jgi:hypothetical protein
MRRAHYIFLLTYTLAACNYESENPPQTEQPLTFAVIGDYGYDALGPAEEKVADLVKSWNPGFIITLGDNNYDSGAASTIDRNIGKYYHSYIDSYIGAYGEGALTNKFFPSLGNHDWLTPHAAPYLEYFVLPGNERYYDFIEGPVHFYSIDSDPHEPDGTDSSSAQARWLKQALAGSTSKWNIVFFHHPPYSSGYCCAPADTLHGSWMRWPFRRWGASVVLSGHAHSYERLYIDSLFYIVNGLGGAIITLFQANPVPGTIMRYNGNNGAMRVTAYSSSIKFEFVDVTGAVIDPFEIVESR